MRKYIIVISFFLLFSPFSLANIWYVPGQCPTIQAALDTCSTGDTVLVSLGTYFEELIWPSTNGIKLLSELGPNWTIIDANDDSSGLVIKISTEVDTSTVISGFTIRNGIGWTPFILAGGIYCENSSPVICNNIITQNIGSVGGIKCEGNSSPIIKENIICNNYSSGGGGIFCHIESSPQIIDNVIVNNTAFIFISGGGYGGGICCWSDSSIIIRGNTIISNTSERYGGAIFCNNSSPIISQNTIVNNSSLGGSITCGSIGHTGISSPVIDSCFIFNNNSDGIYCYAGSNPNIIYNDIFSNTGYGLRNESSNIIVNAINNWWGDNSGPYHPILNPDGLGDEVSDNIDFEPWLIKVVNEVEIEVITAEDYTLYQNHPNPFNPSTKIKYQIPQLNLVTLKVYDVLGNEVATIVNEEKQAGTYEITWYAEGLPSGVYFYQLQADSFVETKKMILMK
jgi:predicted outer membrane repeat protein